MTENTVDPWIAWVWTAQVHFSADCFSINVYRGTTLSTVGWLCGCGTTGGGLTVKLHGGFDSVGFGTLHPHTVQGSAVYVMIMLKVSVSLCLLLGDTRLAWKFYSCVTVTNLVKRYRHTLWITGDLLCSRWSFPKDGVWEIWEIRLYT